MTINVELSHQESSGLYGEREIASGSTSDDREGIAFGSIWNAFGMSGERAIAKGYCGAKNSSSSS
jgi:hypothetical protein